MLKALIINYQFFFVFDELDGFFTCYFLCFSSDIRVFYVLAASYSNFLLNWTAFFVRYYFSSSTKNLFIKESMANRNTKI